MLFLGAPEDLYKLVNPMETALEHILTHAYKVDMISYLKSHPEDFEEAIRLAITDKKPYSWRAAWLLWSCMDNNDPRIQKYVKDIIHTLQTTNDNQLRELLIILQKMELEEKYEGELFNICMDVWGTIKKKPALRYNAFKLIIKIVKKHPELSGELNFLTQNHYTDSLSDTAKKSILAMIKGL